MDAYMSHIDVLVDVINYLAPIDTVVETGMGKYSTPLLIGNGVRVVSIETESLEWFQKCVAAYSGRNWQATWIPKEKGELEALDSIDAMDLLFIDGRASTRAECITRHGHKAKVIVCHDTEVRSNYDKAVIGSDYSWINVINKTPTTGVITKEQALIEMLKTKYDTKVVQDGRVERQVQPL